MRNRNSSFEDIIKSVDAAVKSNSISEKYADFLNQCKELGISSYSLNTIIHYSNENKKNKNLVKDFDKELFVSDLKQKEENLELKIAEKQAEIDNLNERVEASKGWVKLAVFLLVLSFIFIVLYGKAVERNYSNKKEITSYKEQLLKADSVYEAEMCFYENQLFKADSLFGDVLSVVDKISNGKDRRFNDWASTNHNHSSESKQIYSFDAQRGDKLYYCYFVSSEPRFDSLIISIIERDSDSCIKLQTVTGEEKSKAIYHFSTSGSFSLEMKYKKDGSVNKNQDKAEVSNIFLRRSHEIELDSIKSIVAIWKNLYDSKDLK